MSGLPSQSSESGKTNAQHVDKKSHKKFTACHDELRIMQSSQGVIFDRTSIGFEDAPPIRANPLGDQNIALQPLALHSARRVSSSLSSSLPLFRPGYRLNWTRPAPGTPCYTQVSHQIQVVTCPWWLPSQEWTRVTVLQSEQLGLQGYLTVLIIGEINHESSFS
mmetsp:Transcript_52607/g.138039  ORF Transcript_52607/g.138039 Transcript_52607/m.138039 type:complete len:164 (-) Transcript_52607:332-823(-)